MTEHDHGGQLDGHEDLIRAMTPPAGITAYADDLYGWAREQAQLLNEREHERIDGARIAVFIEDVATKTMKDMKSTALSVVASLTRWKHAGEDVVPPWLRGQRRTLQGALERSPSLRETFEDPEHLRAIWATLQDGYPERNLPDACPWSWEQMLDHDWMPEPRSGW